LISNYYVYSHKSGDEIVYIGVGQKNRAWNIVQRKSEHKDFMLDSLPFLNVDIFQHNLDSLEAHELERKLIVQHKPKFNKRKVGSVHFNQRYSKWRVMYTKLGVQKHLGYYATQKEANEALEKFWETL